jgi:hypothetical protein
VTSVKLTHAEITLLDRQRAQGIEHPSDIFAWRTAHAAVLAALEAELSEAEAEADAAR